MSSVQDISAAATVSAFQPLSYAIEAVPGVTGLSRRRIFKAVSEGELLARKHGRSTIIEADELQRWIRSLPTRGRAPDAAQVAA